MKKNYVLVLSDRKGAFLAVDKVFAEYGLDIKRASYNKVIDPQTFFVEVEGTPQAIQAADLDLELMGVLPGDTIVGEVELVEFILNDEPGIMLPVLELIDRFGFNITYYNAHVLTEGDQQVLMGLYVERREDLKPFLDQVRRLCPVRVLEYDKQEHVIDNNLFYLNFARGMSRRLGLSQKQEHAILINANRIVQNLENTNNDPFRPFSYLEQFARGIVEFRGPAYEKATRVTEFQTEPGAKGICIEPPAGSNAWILECDDRLLCIDSGYRAYRQEFSDLLHALYPDWDSRRKELFLTHADIDHAGCCDLFDHVYAAGHVLDSFRREHAGVPGWREINPIHRPYNRIGMILSAYESPWLGEFECIGRRDNKSDDLLARCYTLHGDIATLDIEPFHFEVWEGRGGHVVGETVLIDRGQHVCVSGDIFVNVHGETKQQTRFNALAPFLMTSVDSVPDLERKERKYLFSLLDPGDWVVLGGHGALYRYHKREGAGPR